MPSQTTKLAYNNLRTLIKTIDGVNTVVDLGQRVYERLITPEDGAQVFPYLCMPLAGTAGTYPQPDSDDDHTEHVWRISLYGFVDEDNSDPRESNAAETAADLHDAIIDRIMSDPRLGGAVQEMHPVAEEILSGIDDSYGEVQVTLEFRQQVGPSDIP